MTPDPLDTQAAAEAAPSRDALIVDGEAHTFASLATDVARAEAGLDALGLPPDALVAIGASNRPATVAALLALIRRGVAFVPLHPRLTPPERDALVRDAAAACTLDEDTLGAWSAREPAARSDLAMQDGGRPMAVLYTSGTTGRPRGAVLPRRAFLASARGSEANLGWREDDRWLLCLPVCHIGGLSVLTRCLLARRAVVLHARFDADAVLASIARDRATLLSVVPTMLRALLEADRDNALARLRAILVGGAATPEALLDECARRGVTALATYGLTEACSQVTTQPLVAPPVAQRGSGRALAGVELRIAAPVDGVGTIQVRGPTRMLGYHGGPPLADDAWFDTGDLGAITADGTLFVHARRTDLIVTGGENVYPAEVEAALEALPFVRQALVFGVDDATWGQRVAAAIVCNPPGELLDERRLVEALAARLAPHKRPRLCARVDAIPTLASGKPDRASARRLFSPALRPLASR